MALKHLMAGVAVVALMGGPALAQNQDTTQPQPTVQAGEQQQLAQEDMEFATEAAQGGLKEVQLGELAQQQADSDAVKEFGQRMVEDHGKANDQLKQIAQQKGIELPQELAADAQQLRDELQQKSGEEFDRAYMDEMVKDHEEDVEKFRQYTESGQDPDLKSFAEESLPVLEEHLQLAQKTHEQITASAAGVAEQPDAAIATAPQDATQGEQQAATQPDAPAVTQPEQPAAGGTEEPAVTQTEEPATETEEPAVTQTEEPAVTPAPEQQQAATEPGQVVSIEELLGASVVNAEGDEVAEIEDVVIGQGDQYFAILSVGGFLGIGDKKVAVPLDQLQLGEDEAYLMSAETEEQLEQLPEYDEEQYQPLQREG
jgi:putative membrane protein